MIEPLGESRSDTDIIFGLAQKLGLDFQNYDETSAGELGGFLPNGAPISAMPSMRPWTGYSSPAAMKMAELKEHPGGMRVPNPLPVTFKKYEQNGFPTPSGKMEFVSSILEKHSDRDGIDGLPVYNEPKLSPVSTPDVAAEYPLVLGTGTRLPMFVHSRTFRLPWTRSLRREAAVDLNPADAARYGIAHGDLVELSTPVRLHPGSRQRDRARPPGVAHMYHGYPEADVNTLLSGDYLDPISGFPGFKASLCAVKKVVPEVAGAEEVPR